MKAHLIFRILLSVIACVFIQAKATQYP